MHRADARAGMHREHAFRGQRHVDDHPVAAGDAQAFQPVGDAADLGQRLGIGEAALFAVFRDEGHGLGIAAPRLDMAIQAVDRDVGAPAGEPLMVRHLEAADLVPGLRPGQALCPLRPIGQRVGIGGRDIGLGILDRRGLDDTCRRIEAFGDGQQRRSWRRPDQTWSFPLAADGLRLDAIIIGMPGPSSA